jgi:phosphotransferase system  glucose/maltose/N-acetylglucosamine-specific IIC component
VDISEIVLALFWIGLVIAVPLLIGLLIKDYKSGFEIGLGFWLSFIGIILSYILITQLTVEGEKREILSIVGLLLFIIILFLISFLAIFEGYKRKKYDQKKYIEFLKPVEDEE